MRFKSAMISALLLVIPLAANSQYYNVGQDPASLKWFQVKTGRFNVIYPESYGKGGVDFAKALEKASSDLNLLFPVKKFRIPVIIHNHTTQSNGFVAWAPKRMEIFPTPEENTIPLDNNRQLALHELTHVMQMESLNSGFSKVMSVFFGQQFTGLVASLLPMWYIEGNAVFAETFLSEAGRGRSPSFQSELKAIAVERGKLYKYDKLLNGSWRDYTPDHYQFGYQMVAWSLSKNDLQLWNRVLDFTANQPFTLNPVNLSLRKNAGLTKKTLYNVTFDSLKAAWVKDIEIRAAVNYESINPDKKGKYVNYHSPLFAGSDSIIALKTSLYDPPSFVLIRPSQKSERRIHVPGYQYPGIISYAAGKLVWVESRSDPRWDHRNYSVICLKDLKTKLTSQLTFMSRYLSAAISPDGRTIVACENTTDNINNLVLISAGNEKEVVRIPAPGNASLQHPQWSEDGENITLIYLTEAGEGIITFNTGTGQWDVHISPDTKNIQSAIFRNDSLFYISSDSGTDNIYLLTPGKETKAISRSRFGTSDMTLSGSSVIFSDYTSAGKDICILSLNNISPDPYDHFRSSSYLIDRFDIKPEVVSEDQDITYTPVPYRKWQHLFGFHSWMPFWADIETLQSDPSAIRPGATIMSQNHLSTLTTTVGYEYSADKRHLLHSRILWEGWYPVIESRLDYGYQAVIAGDSMPVVINPGIRVTNSVSLPLSFNTGRFSQMFHLSITGSHENRYVYSKQRNIFDNGQTSITGRFYFSNFYRSAYRDFYPRWAQIVDVSFTSSPFDKQIYGTDLAFRGTLYFPGLLKNNGIKLRFESEKLDFSALLTENRIHFPRSYNNIISSELTFLSVDYNIPVVYPDLILGSFLYMNRIRTVLFYDYAQGTGNYHLNVQNGKTGYTFNGSKETFRSFGLELVSDFHLFRIPYPVSCGVQAAWKTLNEAPSLKLIFNIDVYGMNIGRQR